MKSFAQFLTETPKIVDLSQFPVILSDTKSQAQSSNPRFQLNRYISIANAAIQADGVLKAGYKDLSSAANQVAEYATDLIDAKYKHGGRYASLPKELQFFDIRPMHIGLVSSTLAKVEKLPNHPYRTEAIATLKELLPVESLVGYFKNHIVTRVSKSDREAQAAYAAPQSTKDAKKMVADALMFMTNEVKAQYIIQLEEPWVKDLTEFFAKDHMEQLRHIGSHPDQNKARAERNAYAATKGNKWEARSITYIEHMLLPVAADSQFTADGIKYTPKQNWKRLIHLKAEQQANDMQVQFVDKNVRKLASIVETKGNIEGNPTVLNVHCYQGVIEGNIKFQFKDSSAFTVRNKIPVDPHFRHGFPSKYFDDYYSKLGTSKSRKMP